MKKEKQIMRIIKQLFSEISVENNFRKYKLSFLVSFSIGVLVSTLPYIYKVIENIRIEQSIREERQVKMKKKEKKCKDNNSEYIKFINLGFPETAMAKFNICMEEK